MLIPIRMVIPIRHIWKTACSGVCVLSGTWWGALTGFLWGGLVRIFFFHHITWSINSICHTYGKRSFQSDDESTNNWFMALLSFGEGWHNNHHAFPTSVVHGLERNQIDFAAMAITAFEHLGWATQLKLPTQEQMDAKRIDNGSPTSGSRSSYARARHLRRARLGLRLRRVRVPGGSAGRACSDTSPPPLRFWRKLL